MATRLTPQLAVAYRSSKGGEAALLRAAAAAESLDIELAVVVPFVLPADGPGCCGIRGRRWVDMLRQVAEEDARNATRLVAGTAVRHSVTVAEGSSIPKIVAAFASGGDRQLALPEKSSGTVFTRSDLRRTKRLVPGAVRVLSPAVS